MTEVTIGFERGNGNDVIQWCFANLSRPAYLVTWDYFQGRQTISCPSVWRNWTKRLNRSSYGTTRYSSDGKYMTYMTMGFRSPEDATLFALKWGSVPFENNFEVASLIS